MNILALVSFVTNSKTYSFVENHRDQTSVTPYLRLAKLLGELLNLEIADATRVAQVGQAMTIIDNTNLLAVNLES